MTAAELHQRLIELGDPGRAKGAARFFKTAPGESGEGLRFLGLRAAQLRTLAREARALTHTDLASALQSEWHDERAVALLVMTLQYAKADSKTQKALYDLYLNHTHRVNSWALVDCSAPHIVGAHVHARGRGVLDRLARSKSLWERRIAIVATQHLIRKGDFADTLRIAMILLNDKEDLIHKAVGWMLREVGDRDQAELESFLKQHHKTMPRTMLRYAIEKFAERKRKAYLNGKI